LGMVRFSECKIVRVSEPEGTCFETLNNSIMVEICQLLVVRLSVALLRNRARTTDNEPMLLSL
jgi:hypothetical protein